MFTLGIIGVSGLLLTCMMVGIIILVIRAIIKMVK